MWKGNPKETGTGFVTVRVPIGCDSGLKKEEERLPLT
jgi:hypothetical protein